jgi:F420-non-reducing hydrogenase iron-sulfur subunit
MEQEKFEPKITAFVCNWCTYTGADLAGTSRLKQQTNARLIRVPCTGRIDPVFIIKAFEKGADGVLVSGCHPGDCHYNTGNFHARRRWIFFKQLLDFVGIDSSRLYFSWVSASEGKKWVDVVNNVIDSVRAKGPFFGYKNLNKEIELPLANKN